MFFRFLRCLTLTMVLLGLFVPVAGAVQLLDASPSQVDPLSVDTSQSKGIVSDESDTFFDDSYVHEIYLTFDEADYGTTGWYDTLYDSHANDPDDPYFPADFSADGVTLTDVGVRFKGNSSFNGNSIKKSFKIDFDEYDEDNDELVFYDLKKLNLNNGYKDPTMLREKLFLDFAGNFIAAPRAVHVKLYVNGEYYGLYTAVEQVDKTFVQNRFCDDEDGNLFKGASSDAADANDDFGSDLTWLGSASESYYDYYVLKTNETANDYSQLIAFIDVLNNTSPEDFPTALEPLFDVADALQGLALNNLFVNLDAYNGSAHNYYVYDRDDTGQITHIPWDTNESFGRFLMFMARDEDPLELDPFWLPNATRPGDEEERPLMENLWANADYQNDYLCSLQQMLDSGFDVTTMEARIDELADLIRTDLYADPNKLYSNTEFETNLYTNVQDGRDTIYGLRYFVQERADYLQTELATYSFDCTSDMEDLSGTLYLNEFMADNDTTLEDPDEADSYPDWIELYNAGATDIDLQGLYLTDDLADPTQHAITQSLTISAGDYLLLYADNDTEQGVAHVGFKLGTSGEDLAIFNTDGATLIDSYTFGEQTTDISEGRCPDGGDTWVFCTTATPGATNEPCGAAPVISNVSHTPTSPTATQTVTVTATITDDVTLSSTTLWYSATGSYTAIAMTDQGGDVYSAVIPVQTDDTMVSYYIEATDDAGFSITYPADAPANAHRYVVGYEAPTLYLNEFMADNDTILEDPDEAGSYPDWIEIYNPGTTSIDLRGLYLTDDLADPTQHAITQSLVISAGGYLLLYADNDIEQGVAHIGFKLGASGEDLAIFGIDGMTLIDNYTFGEQTTDISEGRCPDGGDTWVFCTSATPGATNEPCGAAPVISNVSHTPTSPTASDVVTVTAVISDVSLVDSAILWYSTGGSFTATAMTGGRYGDTLVIGGSGVYSAVIPAQSDHTSVDYYISATNDAAFSTTSPATAPANVYNYVVGYEAPLLYLNELMADNETTLEDPDEAGSYPDWIELYNPGTESVDLSGLYLTDDLTDPTQFQIPSGMSIPGGGFLLFYADNDTDQGDQHTNFKLSVDGENVVLFGADGGTQIDAITFTVQTTDIAYGRETDGTGIWGTMCEATPGSSNTGFCSFDHYVFLPLVVRQ